MTAQTYRGITATGGRSMAMADILIYRHFPIINGFVQVPPGLPGDKNRVSAAAAGAVFGDSAQVIALGSGAPNTGSKHGRQRFLRLPPLRPSETYAVDPVRVLNQVQ